MGNLEKGGDSLGKRVPVHHMEDLHGWDLEGRESLPIVKEAGIQS